MQGRKLGSGRARLDGRQGLFWLLLMLGSGGAVRQALAADPLRMSFTSQVSSPDRPTITLTADQPLSGLSLAVEPSAEAGQPAAESVPQHFKEKKLGAGKKVVFRIGSGKPGATSWHGMIECQAGGQLWKREISFKTEVSRRLEISFDPNYKSSHLNVDQHFVEVQLSAPAGRGEIHVFADDGSDMGSGGVSFSGEPAGSWLRLSWVGQGPKNPESVVLRLALTLHDRDGNSASIDLYPWAVTVPHTDVKFDSGSAEISEGERSKVGEALKRITTVLDRVEKTLLSFAERGILATPPTIKLYVSGHTDTVGPDPDNLTLSRNRARAIASYFRQNGFKLPVFYVGHGERQPLFKTADNVDDPRNRRADYTLTLDSPPLPGGLSWLKL